MSFKMKWLIAFVCIWTLVSAYPYCGPQLPPPEPVCLPEVIPVPEPVPVIGLLSQIVNKLMVRGEATVALIDNLQQEKHQNYVNFIRESGGPGFNLCPKTNFFIRGAEDFWKTINDIVADIAWEFDQTFTDAITIIEQQFSLVIDQPLVQSWLRELRDIPRIGRNLALQSIEYRRNEWIKVAQIYFVELSNLVRSELCQNPNELEGRYFRILRIGFEELQAVINKLKQDQDTLTRKVIARGFELANNIYNVEILALKYFVS